jgi:LysM repeat protein
MKKLLFILLLFPVLAFAQKTYTVGPKETLFSIGRSLNIHPRELAEYNNISFETGVKIGQVLKIPAVKKMAPLQDVTPATTTTTVPSATQPVTPVAKQTPAVPSISKTTTSPDVQHAKPEISSDILPVYHKVEKKETLYQISQREKVSIDEIKKWNKLTVDGVNEGANLIVGYKKRDTETPIQKTTTPTTTVKTSPTIPKPVVAEKSIVVEEIPSTTKPVLVENPAAKTTVIIPQTKPESDPTKVVRDFNGGKFGITYGTQHNGNAPSIAESGVGAIFKSTSGWNDGKYYCLHNTSPAGTIIKITSKNTNKFVYAKVLDVIPDLKQNEGLLIRLSNAAADELGVSSETFNVTLNY